MGTKVTVHCPACGYDVKPERLGLTSEGSYDPSTAVAHDMTQRIDHFLGRGRIRVEHQPVSIPVALGLLDALKAATARVEADLLAAGVTLPDE